MFVFSTSVVQHLTFCSLTQIENKFGLGMIMYVLTFTRGSILVPIAVLWSLRFRPLRPNQNLHMVVFIAQYVGSSSQQAQSLFSQHPLTGRPPLKRKSWGDDEYSEMVCF